MYEQKLTDKISLNFKGSGIYLIQIKEHKYVGSSFNIKRRLHEHKKDLKANNHCSSILQNSYNKYGIESVIISVLEFCGEGMRLQQEKYWINQLNADCNTIKDPTIYIPNINYNSKTTSKVIYQYDLNGNFIQEFPSVNEAGRSLNKNGSSISQVARKGHCYNKSAYGFLWSYEKVNKLPIYVNNSSKSKIKAINCFDIFTGEEFTFTSIADAVRILNKNIINFNSDCASISSIANRSKKSLGGYYLNRYLIKYTDQQKYCVGKTKLIYNYNTQNCYANKKIIAQQFNMNNAEINLALQDKKVFIYMGK